MSANPKPLRPSAAARWSQCPGSLAMSRLYPDDETPEAAEGEAAHWLIAGGVGDVAPNGVAITDEMRDGAELWADHIASLRDITDTHVEEYVDCPSIHPECGGTPDRWMLARGRGVLHILDYKFGHRTVDVFENKQLITYAAGILDKLGITGREDQHITIEFAIVQPRSYHRDGPVRTWRVNASDLRPHVNILSGAAHRAMLPDAMCQTGPECRDCPARHSCAAHITSGMSAIEVSGAQLPADMTPADLSAMLTMVRAALDRLKALDTGLTAHATALLRQSVRVPGFTLEQGMGRERWNRPVDEVIALGAMMGVDVAKPSTITPKQAIKAGLPAELVKAYAETPAGELKLVPDGSKFARIFGGKTE